MMIAQITKLLPKLKQWAMPVIMGALTIALIITMSLNSKLKSEVAVKTNNIEAYQGIIAGQNAHNNVLRLDVATLASSNDILLQKIDSVKNELKISDKALRTALSTKQETIVSGKDTVLISDSCQFTKVFKPNELTILKIELKDDSLQYNLNIKNDMYLLVHSKKDYKNKNKKFFKRLFSWDWKKIAYYQYDIINTNKLITVGETRVIENATL